MWSTETVTLIPKVSNPDSLAQLRNLIETWDEIMNALEDPNAAANLMSIDFEKAFNRMSHPHCLNALRRLNAEQPEIDMVNAFLFGRTMRVKVGNTLSSPRSVPPRDPSWETSSSVCRRVSYQRRLD